ncbi:MAG: tRNA threonylcarbamoyladenosine dehydratase [Candidatus Accumulibacter sp.]|nr:tRNA threonylcarbamoyladenosine dehydratase [Accumulibacter sp.]MCM8593807.1 tRNA threonylcarbamoyladenosine dehydratase [Accumulibacter sp.]MCM8626151.1 tRNA threonylcarbamoyladenosine dehydratase [Accumulibacter sp.]MDS4047948.1 tRNA threonylcarbamoyladenosine dehydratase [Accumulibacter sp.]
MNAPPATNERRFGGVARLYGQDAIDRLNDARVAVVGIGGVGSWTAEALARSAVGSLTLVDLDMIAESNVNRQIHALEGEFGRAKVTAMAERIRSINPACRVTGIEDFVTRDNVAAILRDDLDYIVDATDQVYTKAAMIAWARGVSVPLITAGGAGGQTDPTRIRVADLAQTIQDPLLSRVRALLRRHHGFTREPGKRFGVTAVFSSEPLKRPAGADACAPRAAPAGLNCAGFGSSVCVTASFGLHAAGVVLNALVSRSPAAAAQG